jgi:hypothetical protein
MGRQVATHGASAAALVEAGRERTRPLEIRPESQMRRARPLDRAHPRGAPAVGRLGKACPEAIVARIDGALVTGLGILDDEEPDVRQTQLSGIDDFDRDDLAAPTQPGERRRPPLGG